jgi:putative transcriptional regulator
MNENTPNSLEGKVLIADPFLQDPFFCRSVVLLTEHNEEGSIGFILNKPIDLTIDEAVEGFPEFDKTISLGGPVEQEVMFFLHTRGDILDDTMEIVPGVYWGGDFEKLKAFVSQGMVAENEIFFFLGYAGWSPEQLKEELAQGNWTIADFSMRYLKDADEEENTWKRAILRSDNKNAILANFPENPSLN